MRNIDPNEAPDGYMAVALNPEIYIHHMSSCTGCSFNSDSACNRPQGSFCGSSYRKDRRDVIFLPKTPEPKMPSPTNADVDVPAVDLRKAQEHDRCELPNGGIVLYVCWFIASRTHKFTDGIHREDNGKVVCGGPSSRNIIRNLSEEERNAKAKSTAKSIDPWDGIIRLPEKRCQCCGQVVK